MNLETAIKVLTSAGPRLDLTIESYRKTKPPRVKAHVWTCASTGGASGCSFEATAEGDPQDVLIAMAEAVANKSAEASKAFVPRTHIYKIDSAWFDYAKRKLESGCAFILPIFAIASYSFDARLCMIDHKEIKDFTGKFYQRSRETYQFTTTYAFIDVELPFGNAIDLFLDSSVGTEAEHQQDTVVLADASADNPRELSFRVLQSRVFSTVDAGLGYGPDPLAALPYYLEKDVPVHDWGHFRYVFGFSGLVCK